jgi:hypothetical protein
MNHENAIRTVRASDSSVLEVLRAARLELDALLKERADITRRIGTARQAIIGLANLVGGQVLHEAVLDLMDLRPTHRQSGFTRACRYLLTVSNCPLNSTEICEELRRKFPEIAARHKDLQASATTVMNRLIDYGEAAPCRDAAGRRAWSWVAAHDTSLAEIASARDLPAPFTPASPHVDAN